MNLGGSDSTNVKATTNKHKNMKITCAASAALLLTCALGYAQVPQHTDMEGARHRLAFGKDHRAPLAVSAAQLHTESEPLDRSPEKNTTDLGASLSELEQRYGRPVKTELSYFGRGLAYGFQPDKNSYVYATTDSNQKVASVTYFKFDRPFTAQEKNHLLRQNLDPHRVWEGDRDAHWDGSHELARMGAENGHHQVIREANGPQVVIGNDHKNDKSGVISYQVRTGEEFNFEQPIIKKAMKS
jgi:hypothetical protein